MSRNYFYWSIFLFVLDDPQSQSNMNKERRPLLGANDGGGGGGSGAGGGNGMGPDYYGGGPHGGYSGKFLKKEFFLNITIFFR